MALTSKPLTMGAVKDSGKYGGRGIAPTKLRKQVANARCRGRYTGIRKSETEEMCRYLRARDERGSQTMIDSGVPGAVYSTGSGPPVAPEMPDPPGESRGSGECVLSLTVA